jgi:hypothetical protein
VIHALLYGVRAFLLYRAIRWRDRLGFSLPRVLAIVGIMAVWGVLDEVHQYWIPGRSVEATDVMADVIGATVGALAASIAQARPGGGASPSPTARKPRRCRSEGLILALSFRGKRSGRGIFLGAPRDWS